MPRVDLAGRFWGKVKKTPTCWVWTGGQHSAGYGVISIAKGKPDVAHRAVFKVIGVEIPAGLYVDHKCRNRLCVNPDHLRFVTPAINCMENTTNLIAKNKLKTHCPKGHPYTKKNTFHRKDYPSHRDCRTCRTAQNMKTAVRRKAERHVGRLYQ